MFKPLRQRLTNWIRRPASTEQQLIYAPFGRVLYPHARSGDDSGRATFDRYLLAALGGQTTLDDATLARAFGVSATAFACAQYRANTTANLPLHVISADGQEVDALLLDHFVRRQAPRVLYETTLSLLIYGRCYLWKQHSAAGWPVGLQVMNPQQVREITGERMMVIAYELRDEFGYLIGTVTPNEIVYLQSYDTRPGGMGLSLFEVAWRALNIEHGLAIHAASFFTNSARIDGMLTFDQETDEQTRKEARAQWEKFKGAQRAHQTAVMPSGAHWTPIQAVPKDLGMAELKADDRADIAAVFGVDLALVGLADIGDPLSANSTYSAKETSFIRSVALPHLQNVILPGLNDQWASVDLDQTYTLAVNQRAIPQLAEAQLAQAETMKALAESGLVDYDEARSALGQAERGDYLRRAPDEALALWNAGALSLNELRAMVLGQTTPLVDPINDVVMVAGQVIPRARLAEVAHRNADNVGALTFQPPPFPTGGGLPGAGTPELPPPSSTPQLLTDGSPLDETRGRELWAGLDFANQPDLIALQARLRTLLGEGVTWNDPDSFHVTLLFAPVVTDAQRSALAEVLREWKFDELTTLALRVGSLNAFDSLGEYALHFRIRHNALLREWQRRVYDAAVAVGIQPSAYSAPDAYKPHITMGYSKEKPRPIRFDGRLAVTPTGVLVEWDGDDLLEALVDVADDGIDDDEVTAAQESPTQRAAPALEMVVPVANHALIEAARRTASDQLTQVGVLNVEWLPPAEWAITLARAMSWTPSAVAKLLRSADFDGARRIDLRVTGAVLRDGMLGLTLEPNVALMAMTTSAAEELRSVGLVPQPGDLTIALARINQPADPVVLPDIQPFPLVATSIALRRGTIDEQVWTLRGLSGAQAKELQNWEHVVRRKGRDAAFTCAALDAVTDAFVRLSLEDIDIDEAVLFDTARALVRAFGTTQAEFISEIEQIIGRAARGDSSRAKFGGEMRAALRRFGLVAFRDGMKEVGYDPESFGPDELAAFREWQTRQSEFVTGIGDEIFREGGLIGGAEQAAARARMWGLVSLESAREAGMAVAAPNQRFIWVMGPTEEHCRDCVRLNGQVHTMREWKASGYTPTSGKTECKSFNCECQLVPTDQPVRGDF